MDCDFGDGSHLRVTPGRSVLSAGAIIGQHMVSHPVTESLSRIDQEADTCLSFLGPQTKADFYSRCHDIFSGRASSISNYGASTTLSRASTNFFHASLWDFHSGTHDGRSGHMTSIHAWCPQVERVRHPRRLFDLFPPRVLKSNRA